MASHWIKSGRRSTWRCVTTVCWPTTPVYMWVHCFLRGSAVSGPDKTMLASSSWCGCFDLSLLEEHLSVHSPPFQKGLIWSKTTWCKPKYSQDDLNLLEPGFLRGSWNSLNLHFYGVINLRIEKQKHLIIKCILDVVESETSLWYWPVYGGYGLFRSNSEQSPENDIAFKTCAV